MASQMSTSFPYDVNYNFQHGAAPNMYTYLLVTPSLLFFHSTPESMIYIMCQTQDVQATQWKLFKGSFGYHTEYIHKKSHGSTAGNRVCAFACPCACAGEVLIMVFLITCKSWDYIYYTLRLVGVKGVLV
jgi:hypothetical protein